RYADRLRAFAKRTGLIDPAGLEALLARSGDRRWFSLVNLMVWHEQFVEGARVPSPREREQVPA
ncbi:MAG: hypothetical protein AAFP86_08910, partial [Planctomycetota bacterium]